MKKTFLTLIIVILLATFATAETVDVIRTYNSSKMVIHDSWVDDTPNTNHGQDTTFKPRWHSGASAFEHGYMTLNLTPIIDPVGGLTISNVTMFYYFTGVTTARVYVSEVFDNHTSSNWHEDTLLWGTRPCQDAGSASGFPTTNRFCNSSILFNLTTSSTPGWQQTDYNDAERWDLLINGSRENVSLALYNKDDSNVDNSINTSESTDPYYFEVHYEYEQDLYYHLEDVFGKTVESYTATSNLSGVEISGSSPVYRNRTELLSPENSTVTEQICVTDLNERGKTTCFTIEINYSTSNQTLTLSSYNMSLNIYDEILGKDIDHFSGITVNVEVTSSNFSQNYSTNTSSLNVTNITGGEYRINYFSNAYTERDYYVTLDLNDTTTADLYLLSTGNSTNVDFTIEDENSKAVDNLTIKMLRYYVSSNSYITVAMSRTDQNGKARINLESFNEFYYFVLEKAGTTYLITDPARIIDTAITYSITLGENVLESRAAVNQLFNSIQFVNDTDTFRFVYNSGSSIIQEVCLKVDRITPTSTTNLCNNCSSSSSTTLLCGINRSQSGLFKAQATLETSTENSPYVLDLLEVLSNAATQSFQKFGLSGVYLVSYVIMAFALLGLPYPWVSILFASIGFIFTTIAGIIGLSYSAITSIVIIAAIIIMRMKR